MAAGQVDAQACDVPLDVLDDEREGLVKPKLMPTTGMSEIGPLPRATHIDHHQHLVKSLELCIQTTQGVSPFPCDWESKVCRLEDDMFQTVGSP